MQNLLLLVFRQTNIHITVPLGFHVVTSDCVIGRCSMFGLMLLLDMSPLLLATLLIGRSGGRIQRMSSCISLWEKTMCHSTL